MPDRAGETKDGGDTYGAYPGSRRPARNFGIDHSISPHCEAPGGFGPGAASWTVIVNACRTRDDRSVCLVSEPVHLLSELACSRSKVPCGQRTTGGRSSYCGLPDRPGERKAKGPAGHCGTGKARWRVAPSSIRSDRATSSSSTGTSSAAPASSAPTTRCPGSPRARWAW